MRTPRLVKQFIAVDPGPENTGVVVYYTHFPGELQLFHGKWEEVFPFIQEKIALYGIGETKLFFEDVVWFSKGGSRTLENYTFVKEQRAILRFVYGEDNVWSPYPKEWKAHFEIEDKKPFMRDLEWLLKHRGIEKTDVSTGVLQKKQKFPQDLIDACFILFHGIDTYYASLQSK